MSKQRVQPNPNATRWLGFGTFCGFVSPLSLIPFDYFVHGHTPQAIGTIWEHLAQYSSA